MQKMIAALTLILAVLAVATRVVAMRRKGVKAMHLGELDKTDFLIPPFALFYFYLVFADAFGWPAVSLQVFFRSEIASWIGAAVGLAGILLLLSTLVFFGTSFRVGIDTGNSDKLVTTGVFALSRNPIYVAFAWVLLGQFLVFPNWILLVYAVAGVLLFHRQVVREEAFLKTRYGEEYLEYCGRVRRYL